MLQVDERHHPRSSGKYWLYGFRQLHGSDKHTTPHFLDKAKGKTLPLAKTKKRDGKKEQVRRLIQVESGHRGVERGL
ncbi:MAG: hypothetical protein PUJ24_10115, partial [Bacteroidales bacterium]|nr:hypothetical protein [Bacteroidales bacterium]